jgi:hypothetical protein
MERIGSQEIWSYFDGGLKARSAPNRDIRRGAGHPVQTYFELAKKVAELQFMNREHVLLFRGQGADYRTMNNNTALKPSLFRLNKDEIQTREIFANRFSALRSAEASLAELYAREKFTGLERLKRYRVLRWAILQHYEVCRTPLLDVTHSLRIAASFASLGKESGEAFLFVLGVPNLSGAITASAESCLQVIRLSSACPPDAVRPHLQEGYLLGEYPEISDFEQNRQYEDHEMDFGRRLVAKFHLDLKTFWRSQNFPPAPPEALYPRERRDSLLNLTQELKVSLSRS